MLACPVAGAGLGRRWLPGALPLSPPPLTPEAGVVAGPSEQGRPATGGGGPHHGSPAGSPRRVGALPAAPAPAEPAARRAGVGGQGRAGSAGTMAGKLWLPAFPRTPGLALPTAGARPPGAWGQRRGW